MGSNVAASLFGTGTKKPFLSTGSYPPKSTALEELCRDCTCAWRIDFRLSPLPCLVHQFAVDGLRNRIALDSFLSFAYVYPLTSSFYHPRVRKRRHLQCNKISNSFPSAIAQPSLKKPNSLKNVSSTGACRTRSLWGHWKGAQTL